MDGTSDTYGAYTDKYRFTMGDCWLLATVLSEASGGKWLIAEAKVVGHCFAVLLEPENSYTKTFQALDIEGKRPVNDLLIQWSYETAYVPKTEDYDIVVAHEAAQWGDASGKDRECFEGSWDRARQIAPSMLDGTYPFKFPKKGKGYE